MNHVYESTVQNWDVKFEECFSVLTQEQLSEIVEKLRAKYTDFDDMMARKYEDMRWTFSESDRSKLFAVIPDDAYLSLKHLEIREDRISFVGILCTGAKCQRWYVKSIGKLFVPR
jgi:hypothetical protein